MKSSNGDSHSQGRSVYVPAKNMRPTRRGARGLGRVLIWLVLLLLAIAVLPCVQAADDLNLVRQRVAQVPVLRGDFEQEKQISGFKNPLRSQGHFLLARDKGVVWTTVKPFPSEVVLTRDRILSRQRDGSTRTEMDARQQPALRSVNLMMFALMSGDVESLSSRFNIQVQAQAKDGWRITLKPKPGALARSFESIVLNGDRYVRQVEIAEANGDRTQLKFLNLRDTPASLGVDEAKRFD
jgi:outer membrane lipoprotein-sorting protein